MKQVTLLSLMLLSSMLNQAQESENSAPVVTNVIVVKVDFERVLIRFDVEDTEGDKSKIYVKLSSDGGKTSAHTRPVEQLLEEEITIGTDKE